MRQSTFRANSISRRETRNQTLNGTTPASENEHNTKTRIKTKRAIAASKRCRGSGRMRRSRRQRLILQRFKLRRQLDLFENNEKYSTEVASKGSQSCDIFATECGTDGTSSADAQACLQASDEEKTGTNARADLMSTVEQHNLIEHR